MANVMEDALRVVQWYLDPKNHDAVARIARPHSDLGLLREAFAQTQKVDGRVIRQHHYI